MATRISELFGFHPYDQSEVAVRHRARRECPFLGRTCTKHLSDNSPSGVCTMRSARGLETVICPVRLYANDFESIKRIGRQKLGNYDFQFRGVAGSLVRRQETILCTGKERGGEIRLPGVVSPSGTSSNFYIDWVLLLASPTGLQEFIALEVETVDTTGNYQAERLAALAEREFDGTSTAGFNWQNVAKRILPQLIFKGHVLRRERLCLRGLHFMCPDRVFEKILDRVGHDISEIAEQPGSITFHPVGLSPDRIDGSPRSLTWLPTFTTTVDQLAMAFVAPRNLPEAGSYEASIRSSFS